MLQNNARILNTWIGRLVGFANESAKVLVAFSLGALFGFYSAAICIAVMRGNL